MRELIEQADRVAALLQARRETVAVAESSAGGLITAALLAVPGASAYCLGAHGHLHPAGLGSPAGHACLAVSGPSERAVTLRTGSSDRLANMHRFAGAALQLLLDALG